jgi:hypothetical protein
VNKPSLDRELTFILTIYKHCICISKTSWEEGKMAAVLLGVTKVNINPLNAKLNPICHLLALLGAHPILHVSRIRVKYCWFSREPLVFPDRCAVVMIYLPSVTRKKKYRTANTIFFVSFKLKMTYLEYYRNLCTTVHIILDVLYMS